MVILKKKETAGEEVENYKGDFLTIPAMGRFAEIGTPYSEHTGDLYIGVNVFKDLNKKYVKSNEVDVVKTGIQMSDLHQEKANNGLGSLHCLLEFAKINENLKKGAKAKADVKKEEIESRQSSLKKVQQLCNRYSCVDVLQETKSLSYHEKTFELGATHFVVGIKWGADMQICWDADVTVEGEMAINKFNASLSVENCEDSGQDQSENLMKGEKSLAETTVESRIENATGATSSDTEFRSKDGVRRINKLFVATSNGFTNFQMPKTMVDAVTVIDNVHVWKMVNDGKGFPLEYYVIPISCLNQSSPLVPLTKPFTDTMKKILKQIDDYHTMVNLCESLVNQYREYLPLRCEKQDVFYLRKYHFKLDKIKKDSIALIPKSRQAEISLEIEINMQSIGQEIGRFENVKKYLRQLKEIIQFIQEIEERGVIYAKRTFSLTNFILKNLDKSVCVYFAEWWNEDSFKNKQENFFKLAEGDKSIAIFLDKRLFDIFYDRHGLVCF